MFQEKVVIKYNVIHILREFGFDINHGETKVFREDQPRNNNHAL